METKLDILVNSVLSLEEGVLFARSFDERIKDEVTDLNTEDQLFDRGINSEGVKLSNVRPEGGYTDFTIGIKKLKGQPFDRVTLRDTGEFHSSFRVKVDNKGFVINSDPLKTDGLGRTTNLLEEWGKHVEGLTDENQTKINELVKENFIKATQEALLRGL